MGTGSVPATAASSQLAREVARTGAVSFAGSAFAAAMGFALTLVLARTLGSTGAGAALQAIAVFMIALSLARAGMDTAAVFLVPRLLASDSSLVAGSMTVALGAPALVGTLCALAITVVTTVVVPPGDVATALAVSVWALPLGAMMLVALAALRAMGSIWSFVAVGSVTVPVLRPAGVLLAVALGGGAVAATFAWALPFLVGLVAALWLLGRRLRSLDPRGRIGRLWPTRTVALTLSKFAAGRVLATTMEQALVWLDVVLVGILAGQSAAGVYGTASRFVAAGLIVDTALRIVVAPMLSRLLYEDRIADTQRLFSQVTGWLVLLSTPVYVLLAVHAEVILGWLGTGFADGATALVILCVGISLTLAAGNIHSLLLMSGHSGWSAVNKACVLTVNVVGDLVLVPQHGINAAATVWAASMLLDAAMASIEVRHLVGVRLEPASILYAFAVVGVCVGVPAYAGRLLLGDTAAALLASAAVSAVALAGWCYADRRRLRLTELFAMRRDQV